MTPTRQGSIRLFRFAGIDVYLHWLWFLAAYYLIKVYAPAYTSLLWPVLECLALFGIVLLHEFGHALACRQVGGQANLIVLWPLGGVAYVAPPQRPGATLWSLAAGPLVNVALLPLLGAAWLLVRSAGGAQVMPDAYHFIRTVFLINTVLLVFNLLPVYPLDGGQILQSLLWFIFGRARSLMIVHGDWLCRGGGAAGAGFAGAQPVVRHPERVHPHPMLERAAAGASVGESGPTAAPRRAGLPVVPPGPHHRPDLAL